MKSLSRKLLGCKVLIIMTKPLGLRGKIPRGVLENYKTKTINYEDGYFFTLFECRVSKNLR